jgi:hypothetical protein
MEREGARFTVSRYVDEREHLAVVLGHQGKYDEVEKLSRQALEGSEKELGAQHPDTLTSIYCFAYLLHK